MSISFFIYVAISSATGTAIMELVINLFLSHFLQKKYYEFTIKKSDKRACAEELLELINSRNYQSWFDFSNDIYNKAYLLSDRLVSLDEEKSSKKLDTYVSEHRYSKQALDRSLSGQAQSKESAKDFIESLHKIDVCRSELVEIAKKLRIK